jgi:simple sugar transport system ATP-binding protein
MASTASADRHANRTPSLPGGVSRATGAAKVEVIGLTKRFGAFTALDGVSMRVAAGSVHALLGENGAGKSTLVKALVGFHRADAGQITVDDREADIRSAEDADRLGIGMVYQHFTAVPSMTVAENMVVARRPLPVRIDWRREKAALAAFMERAPFRLPLDAPAGELAAGQRQKLEILKQLFLGRRFIVLDEPTSVLTPDESDEVLGRLRDVAHSGELTILLITHKLREVMAHADRVTVLRRGLHVGDSEIGETDPQRLAAMMVGEAAARGASGSVARRTTSPGPERLVVRGLAADGDAGLPAVRGVDLAVRGGEIVGIAGVSGNGQRELVEALVGQRVASAGSVEVDGRPFHATRREIREARVYCLPEEPLRNACLGDMSVSDNLALRVFDVAPFSRGPWLSRKRLVAHAAELVAAYRVRTPGLDAPMRALSGGNVQRAVLARELEHAANVLIAANPTFGLDLGAVATIHGRLREARDRGTAVLVISEDLDELLELADRVLVMSEGRLVHETPAATADIHVIGRHMAGMHDAEHAAAA